MRSKQDLTPSEGHFRVKAIMKAAILKGRSKPKCSNLATSKGSSEWRISKGTTDGHFGLPWSFAQILCMMMAPPCWHGMMTQKGTSRTSCLVLCTLQPFEALTGWVSGKQSNRHCVDSGAGEDKMSQVKRLRCSVFGFNNEYSSRHLLPTSEPLKMQWITFVFGGNAPPDLPKCAYVCANHSWSSCTYRRSEYKGF